MLCPHCNAANADGSKFCTSCGKPLTQHETPPQPAETPAPAPAQPTAPASAPAEHTTPASAPAESQVTQPAQPAAPAQPTQLQETPPTPPVQSAEPAPAQPAEPAAAQPTPPAGAPVEPTAVIPPVGTANQAGATTPPPGYTPPGAMPPKPESPWYGKTWVIILFLIFIWPVGIILMWMKSCTWEKAIKIVVSVLYALSIAASIFFVTSIIGAFTNYAANVNAQNAITSTQPGTSSNGSNSGKDSGGSSNPGNEGGSSNSGNSGNSGSSGGSSGSGNSGTGTDSAAINYANTRFGYSCTLPAGFTLLSESANGDGATYFNSQYNMTVKVFGFNNTDGLDGSQLEESWWNGSTSASTQNLDNLWLLYQYDNSKEYVYAAYVGEGSIVEVDIDFPLQSDNTEEMDIAAEITISLTPGDLTVAH